MTATSKQELAALPVEFKLNGRDVIAYGEETIIQAAQRHGVEMPITESVHSVLFEGKDVIAALTELMSRDPKPELE